MGGGVLDGGSGCVSVRGIQEGGSGGAGVSTSLSRKELRFISKSGNLPYCIAKLNSVQSQYPTWCWFEVVGNESLLSLARNLILGTVFFFFILERGPVLFDVPPPLPSRNPILFQLNTFVQIYEYNYKYLIVTIIFLMFCPRVHIYHHPREYQLDLS